MMKKATVEEEPVSEHIVIRASTKLALETVGHKNDNYDDVLRNLLKDHKLFQKALQSAYILLEEERKVGKSGKASPASQ